MTRQNTGRRVALFVSMLACLALGIVCGAYFGGGDRLASIELSPDGHERLEFYYPNRWVRLWHPNGDYYVYARLTRVPDDETLGTSSPFEMSGDGEVRWGPKQVEVGMTAVFNRNTGVWRVPR